MARQSLKQNGERSTLLEAPHYCRPEAYAAFRDELDDLDTTRGLFRAAFAIALHQRPEVRLTEVETVLENLIETIQRRARRGSQQAVLAHLHDVLFDVYGLRGNEEDYYNPANSFLPDVVRTRKGIPISLTLIYKYVGEALGLKILGVNAPGHFLAEVVFGASEGEKSMYVDPFFHGGVLNRQEVLVRVTQATGRKVSNEQLVFRRATHRQWLRRMLTNLQAAFSKIGQDRDVCAMLELESLLNR